MALIKQRQLHTQDNWQFIDADEHSGQEQASTHAVWPLEQLAKATVTERPQAVWLDTEQDIEPLLPHLQQLQLIAIHFPVFRDGRGFSLARLLRRSGYQGELRAVGAVARDQLAHLEKCGFDAFEIPDERFQPEDLDAFTEIDVSYQAQLQAGVAHVS